MLPFSRDRLLQHELPFHDALKSPCGSSSRKRRRSSTNMARVSIVSLLVLARTGQDLSHANGGSNSGAYAFSSGRASVPARGLSSVQQHAQLQGGLGGRNRGCSTPYRWRPTRPTTVVSLPSASSETSTYDFFGGWREAATPEKPATNSRTEELSRASYVLVRSAVERADGLDAGAVALAQAEEVVSANGGSRLEVDFKIQQRVGRFPATAGPSPAIEISGGGVTRSRNTGEGKRKSDGRRRAELDSGWPGAPGDEVPFEFSAEREAMNFPCTIQLVQRVERMSLVYVNGVEVSRRNSGGATATANGRVAALGVGAAIVAADQPQSPQQRARADVEGEGVGGFAGGLGIRAGDGAGIRLVGEMAISRPAYLQVRKGTNGRSDTLYVSQFGFTRSGAVSSLDLDPSPPPTNSLLDLSTTVAVAVGGDAGGVDVESFQRRPKPRLKGTVSDPLLWPNEVNQIPPAALLRLASGKQAELRYLARMEARKRKRRDEHAKEQRKKAKAALQQQTLALPRRFSNNIDGITGLPLPPLGGGAAAPMGPKQADTRTSGWDESVVKSNGSVDIKGGSIAQNPRRNERDTHRMRVDEDACGHAVVYPKPADAVLEATDAAEDDAVEALPEAGVLVADGFLLPGKADGGVYIVVPADAGIGREETIICLTGSKRGWFYHKAVWLVLPGGKKVVLTARVHKPLFGPAEGELILLEMPQVDKPLAGQNLPWREIVLVEGPDVMFEVIDLDPSDTTVEVVCAEFFGGRLTMHSIAGGATLPGGRPFVSESWMLDNNTGPAYAVAAADLRGGSPGGRPTHLLVTTHECTYDYSFFPPPAGKNRHGPSDSDSGISSHHAVRLDPAVHGNLQQDVSDIDGFDSGESVDDPHYTEPWRRRRPEKGARAGWGRAGGGAWGGVVAGPSAGGGEGGGGGALMAYQIPQDWRVYPREYPSPGWRRVTLASGFRVRGLSINPGAPGFPYVFHPHKSMEGKCRPYIALAGDCSQSAYILRPTESTTGEAAPRQSSRTSMPDAEATPISYEVVCAIDVPGTVGSLAVSYGALLEGKRNSAVTDMVRPLPNQQRRETGSPRGDLLVGLRRRRLGGVGAGGQLGNQPLDDDREEAEIVDRSHEDIFSNRHFDDAEGDRGSRDDGWAKLFVPNYDGNRIYVFTLEPAP